MPRKTAKTSHADAPIVVPSLEKYFDKVEEQSVVRGGTPGALFAEKGVKLVPVVALDPDAPAKVAYRVRKSREMSQAVIAEVGRTALCSSPSAGQDRTPWKNRS